MMGEPSEADGESVSGRYVDAYNALGGRTRSRSRRRRAYQWRDEGCPTPRYSPGGGWKGAGRNNYYWKRGGCKGSKGGGCKGSKGGGFKNCNVKGDKGGYKAHIVDAGKGDKGGCKNNFKGSNHDDDPTVEILANLSIVLATQKPL